MRRRRDDTVRHGRYKAHNKCLAWGKGSEAQTKLFYVLERRRELDGRALSRGGLATPRNKALRNQRGDNEANVIFGEASGSGLVTGHDCSGST